MLQPMVESVLDALLRDRHSTVQQTREYRLATAEGAIASPLEAFSDAHPELSIGIYPSTTEFRREVTVRLRYPPDARAQAEEFERLIEELRASLKRT